LYYPEKDVKILLSGKDVKMYYLEKDIKMYYCTIWLEKVINFVFSGKI